MIYELVNGCIEFETERGTGKTTLKELSRYLHEFADYCQQNPITLEQIGSDFMRRYVQYRWQRARSESYQSRCLEPSKV